MSIITTDHNNDVLVDVSQSEFYPRNIVEAW